MENILNKKLHLKPGVILAIINASAWRRTGPGATYLLYPELKLGAT
jgi:hypothetical protein